MAATLEQLTEYLSVNLEEGGEDSETHEKILAAVDTLPDLTVVERHMHGEDARWGSRDWVVFRNGDGHYFGVRWYAGSGEQGDHYEGVTSHMERRMVPHFIEAEAVPEVVANDTVEVRMAPQAPDDLPGPWVSKVGTGPVLKHDDVTLALESVEDAMTEWVLNRYPGVEFR